MARWFFIIGALLIVIGAVLQFAPWLLNWFGKLPGDIRYEGENSRVYIPLTSMILLSLLATFILNLIRRL